MNLTNDKKTKKQIREHTRHIHLSMYKFTLFYPQIFLIVAVKVVFERSREKWIGPIQY